MTSLASGISAGSTAANALDTSSQIAQMQANTTSTLAIQAAATEMQNAINNDMIKDQISESGPKNGKSLTQS